MVGENLASEGNAAKINQRFKELETKIAELEKAILTMGGDLNNMHRVTEKQTNMIAQAWARQYGSGSTASEE